MTKGVVTLYKLLNTRHPIQSILLLSLERLNHIKYLLLQFEATRKFPQVPQNPSGEAMLSCHIQSLLQLGT